VAALGVKQERRSAWLLAGSIRCTSDPPPNGDKEEGALHSGIDPRGEHKGNAMSAVRLPNGRAKPWFSLTSAFVRADSNLL